MLSTFLHLRYALMLINFCGSFIPKDAQRLMFSATFAPATVEFAKTLAPNANTITLAIDQIALRTVRQIFVDMDSLDDKYQKVVDMYKCYEIASSIIFCATRATADMLQRRLEAEGHKTVSLHSALESCEARDEMVKRFIDGRAKVTHLPSGNGHKLTCDRS